MTKKIVKTKPIEITRKNFLLGVVGLSQMDVTIAENGAIHIRETFLDPNYQFPNDNKPAMFHVMMNIRPEYVPQLLRVLLENQIEPAHEPMQLPEINQ